MPLESTVPSGVPSDVGKPCLKTRLSLNSVCQFQNASIAESLAESPFSTTTRLLIICYLLAKFSESRSLGLSPPPGTVAFIVAFVQGGQLVGNNIRFSPIGFLSSDTIAANFIAADPKE